MWTEEQIFKLKRLRVELRELRESAKDKTPDQEMIDKIISLDLQSKTLELELSPE